MSPTRPYFSWMFRRRFCLLQIPLKRTRTPHAVSGTFHGLDARTACEELRARMTVRGLGLGLGLGQDVGRHGANVTAYASLRCCRDAWARPESSLPLIFAKAPGYNGLSGGGDGAVGGDSPAEGSANAGDANASDGSPSARDASDGSSTTLDASDALEIVRIHLGCRDAGRGMRIEAVDQDGRYRRTLDARVLREG
jgi:hypothetical protein